MALVIGNAAYVNGRPLRNPINDAKATAKVLRDLGFEVILGLNQDLRNMGRTIVRFGRAVRKNGIAFVYYSGHGIQINGRNYLVPVDARMIQEDEVDFELIKMDRILERLKSRLNVIVLDACRDNPFMGPSKSLGSGGLAPMIAPSGTLISYATAAGRTASDGSGRLSPYTESLLKVIRQPGLEVQEVFTRVREEVYRKTNGRQVAWVSTSVMGDYYFIPPPPKTTPATATTEPRKRRGVRNSWIDVARAWTDTEVILFKGQRYTIKAKGHVSKARDKERITPDGTTRAGGNFRLPGSPRHGMIGRIGRGRVFWVGSVFHGLAPRSGTLYLGMNESSGPECGGGLELCDNKGKWLATIEY